jgi:L-amino acid N-acyltransferase YncA
MTNQNLSAEAHNRVPVTIPPASIEDLPEIVVIWLWRDGQISQGNRTIDSEQAASVFLKRVESQAGANGIWVAEIEGRVVGWQGLYQSSANPTVARAQSSTYIAMESSGRGIGRKLLTFATEHGKSLGLSDIEGFIQASNHAPIRIVESLGWERVGSIPRANPSDIEWLYYVYVVPHGPDAC